MGLLFMLWGAIVVVGGLGWLLWSLTAKAAAWRPKRTVPAPPPPPPELTPGQKAAAAKARFDAKMATLEAAGLDAIELEAARQKAKQAYLRELDGIL